MRSRSILAVAVSSLAFLLLACKGEPPKVWGELETPEAPFSRVRFTDLDRVSLNDRCPITGTRLNPAIEPVYVNGRPIGFC